MKHTKLFFALCSAAVLFAACEKNELKDDAKEAVDLGLSVKWATCNVGANTPEAYGNYYAWGETATKSNYLWDTYKYGTYKNDKDYSKLTKYNKEDGKNTLETADDVAATNWGGKWRMPTDAEWIELCEKCTWTWTDNYNNTSVAGYGVKAANGNSIFLPVAGYRFREYTLGADNTGHYWSSSLNTDTLNMAHQVYFDSHNVYRFNNDRYIGLTVRPVCE